MKEVLWISRHEMTQDQLQDLERICGGPVKLNQWPNTVKHISELEESLETCDVVAAVLNIELLAELKKLAGSKPLLQAKSQRLPTGIVRTLPDGRQEQEFQFAHAGWEEIVRLELETKIL